MTRRSAPKGAPAVPDSTRKTSQKDNALLALIGGLSPTDARDLAFLLRERAERQSRKLTEEEVRFAVQRAALSERAKTSAVFEVLRIRAAAKELSLAGWLPEQFAEALSDIGMEVFRDPKVIAYAVAGGLQDAERLRQ